MTQPDESGSGWEKWNIRSISITVPKKVEEPICFLIFNCMYFSSIFPHYYYGRLCPSTENTKRKDPNAKGEAADTNAKEPKETKERGPYQTQNDKKVASLINLLHEFEHMSIRKGTRKVGLTPSTVIRRVKQWNELTSNGESHIVAKEHKGRQPKLLDKHTLFIFDQVEKEPTLTTQAVTDLLCEHFPDLSITAQSANTHMRTQCRLTFKRTIPQYFARDSEAVAVWLAESIDFMNQCVFIDKSGFNRNMHRLY
ncbi:hypothetical protein DFQ30_001439, partial [Apophysomyces sp. BC1015]